MAAFKQCRGKRGDRRASDITRGVEQKAGREGLAIVTDRTPDGDDVTTQGES
jgi:hypothetical protein